MFGYAGLNPIIFIDPDGNKLVFAKGTSKKFKQQFKVMIKYLNKHKQSAIFAKLQARPETVTIKEGVGLDDFDYTMATKTIRINPLSGLEISPATTKIDPKTGKLVNVPAQVQTPALGALHEGDHALQHLSNPKQFAKDGGTPAGVYTDLEEKRVIQGSEKTAEDCGY